MTPDVDSRPSDAPNPSIRLEHAVVENDDDPDECAVFPTDATEAELRSAWVTARGDDFVDLESVR
ncbi:hypothetical protein EA462_06895 [Natrarchaeobius halalkaliphilus]|uniref:DUF7511 domain-containing protein n=1 Tax=Natrarchaeobius halalkaliphilus TaxID=1679091 RepID=A0A3N6LSW7_9EURY|nr:hypothetical protein [Natrarchaeobius halalkaliphilus]RQG91667.1 hypothetical protein EA462_06895 [Natrarchaeobius halalkaliphilus]